MGKFNIADISTEHILVVNPLNIPFYDHIRSSWWAHELGSACQSEQLSAISYTYNMTYCSNAYIHVPYM